MAYVVKSSGCDCPECVTDPCDAGCYCAFSIEDSQGASFSTTYDVTGEFITAHDFYFEYSTGGGPGASFSFTLTANGVTVISTGCVTDTGGNITVSIPAGTTSIGLTVTDCSGSDIGGWFITSDCLQNPP